MKRLLAVALVLLMAVSVAIAEDVSSMSDTDLKALYKSVKQELMNRKLWDTSILPAGVYVGGTNLPEGYYEITLNDNAIIAAWPSYESFKRDGNLANEVIFYEFLLKDSKCTISLIDGMCWRIPCDSIVRPYLGFDW